MANIVKLLHNEVISYPVSIPEAVIDPNDGKPLSEALPIIKNKTYSEGTYKGLGRIYLKENIISGVNTLSQSMINASNTIYIIQYEYDLANTKINIPDNCVLKFCGGKFINGNIQGNNTIIDANTTDFIFKNITLSGNWSTGKLYPQWFGAKGNALKNDTEAIQKTIVEAYNINKEVHIPSGEYIITRALYVFDGTTIKGDGIYNSILRTPFSKTSKAKEYVERDKTSYNTVTNQYSIPLLDLENGHNRFYLGDGAVGYYDGDRDSNPDHPLYWPNDGSAEWKEWNSDRSDIISKGIWIGTTGRENYAKGLIKCSQNPNVYFPSAGNSKYSNVNPQGRIHTGVRNVTISGLKIQTNSSDRGKDTAINFEYEASTIPSNIRETYDSSVLNIYISNMYLHSLGGSGIRITRAVNTTIVNCYIHQCADRGISINGVTSINISGCYANSCLDSGYNLKGVNYSTLNGLAADGCGVGYKLNNCNGVSLLSCGAEATRFTPMEDGGEGIYKGRAYHIVNCNGVTMLSCYGMAARPRLYIESTDDDAEFYNTNWNDTRFVLIRDSINVDINQCYFKSFGRIRSNAYRDSNGDKVNYQLGSYDPNSKGSRYWQVQNYLVGNIFEVIGESSSVHINGNAGVDAFIKEQEIRWGNLDILDPGIIINPLASKGVDTAGKTLTGRDGNGGWTNNGAPITMEIFEGLFPINGKEQYGKRDYFWEWRNSLLLVRIKNDASLVTKHPENYYGYLDILEVPIQWNQIANSDLEKFNIDIVNDYSDNTFIDGSSDLFTYGNFAYEDLAEYTFTPKVCSTVPAIVKYKKEGARTTLNTDNINQVSNRIRKAAVGILGNGLDDTNKTNLVLGIQSKQKKSELESNPIMGIDDINGTSLFEIYANNKLIGSNNRKFISLNSDDLGDIPSLPSGSSLDNVITKLNDVIRRLVKHGFINNDVIEDGESGDTDTGIEFSDITILTMNESNILIEFSIRNGSDPVFNVGVAYSSTNDSPVKNDNYVGALPVEGDNFTYRASVPINASNTIRFVRLYCTPTTVDGNSQRVYSEMSILEYIEN